MNNSPTSFCFARLILIAGSAILPLLGATPFTVVSYNIKHGQGMDGKIDLKRIATVIKKENPDLVTLQEIDSNCTRSGQIDQAAELGRLLKMHHRFGKFMDFQGGQYGMAVLSRFPIEKTTRHVLPKGAEPRCALEIVVRPDGWKTPLSLIGIHNDWITSETRISQVTTLLKKLADTKHPVLLAGDFNAQPGSASLAVLKNKGWKMLREKRTPTWPSNNPQQEIDFFFAHGFGPIHFEEKVIAEKVASDHLPIAVTIAPQVIR
ncbi:MAG: endonuclease/exonuclease/phosphatase family protein [Akkermansiaceae bacterium]